MEAFAILLTVCNVGLQELVFGVCRWDGCSLLPVSFTWICTCQPGLSSALRSTGHRTDILLTHHVSFLLLQAVLKDQSQMRQMELEIRPVFLVPDTNGFIDHLGSLVTLLDCRKFILVVPLIGE